MENKELIEAVHAHLDQFADEDEITVFHETESSIVHTDVFWIKPDLEYRPYSILLTCGLSSKAMSIPEGVKDKFAEVAMLLPLDWPLENGQWKEDKNRWPIDHLSGIAKTPYSSGSWVGFGHTFASNSPNNGNFLGTNFNSSVIMSSVTLPEKFTRMNFNKNSIRVFSSIPLYPEELNFKIQNDVNALIDKFNEFNIGEVFDPNRINTCK